MNERPCYPAEMKLGDALARYYAENGLPLDGGDSQSWVWLKIGPMRMPFPNPPARKRAVVYHDAHHVLTGYDTVFSHGEMIIAAWEVRAGCGRVWIAWAINLWMFALGLVCAPRALYSAFVRAGGCTSLYRLRQEPASLKEQSVGDLRRSLGLESGPRDPRAVDFLLFGMWTVLAFGTVVLAVALVGLLGYGAFAGVSALL